MFLEVKKYFKDIKVAISTAPVLVSLDYELSFRIYYFDLKHSCASILTQKKDKDNDTSITFMGFSLKNLKLIYPNLDK